MLSAQTDAIVWPVLGLWMVHPMKSPRVWETSRVSTTEPQLAKKAAGVMRRYPRK